MKNAPYARTFRTSWLPAALAILLASSGVAAGAKPAPFQLPVREKVLANGLTVLVVENPSAQTVACRMVYKVGSANERPGRTGIAHFLEHLMFKGTRVLGVKDLDRDAELRRAIDAVANEIGGLRRQTDRGAAEETRLTELRRQLEALYAEQRKVVVKNEVMETYRNAGGTRVNAMTSNDMTIYVVTLPANKLELFMWVESDRLQNAVFREFHAEKDVVREERRLSENTPTHAFEESLTKLVYGNHPYSWPVIGYHEDLLNATREDVRAFFETYYAPDNAVMVLAGAVKAGEAFELAKRYFGGIPRASHERPELPKVHVMPREERVLRARAKTQPRVELTYYRKPVGDPDEVVYQVIDSLLSGETGRLERLLVRGRGLAVSAGSSARPSKCISTFGVSATTKGDHTPDELLAAIDEVTAELARTPVGEPELRRAKNALRARQMRILKSDGFLSMVLGMYEAQGSWRDLNSLIAAVDGVTARDVRRVAAELFRKENRVVGLLYGEDEEMPEAAAPAAAGAAPEGGRPDHPSKLTYPERVFLVPSAKDHLAVLENGVRVFLVPEPRYPTVTITASFRGGGLWEPADKTGLAAATGELMKRGGTEELTEDELDEALGLLAARISSEIGASSGSVSMTCFDSDLGEVLDLFTEVLLRPAFREDRLLWWKEERLQAIARRNDNPRRVSRREFRRAMHGDHPAARSPSIESVNAIAREDLVAFHRSLLDPKNLVISVAGNFDRKDMLSRLAGAFGDMAGGGIELPPLPESPVARKRVVKLIEMPISQGYVSLGHPGIRRDDPDRLVLQIADAVLQQRIYDRVRSDEGLAYSAYSRMTAPKDHDGVFAAGFQTKSESVAFALSLTFEAIERMRSEKVAEEELEGIEKGLIEGFPGRFSSAEATASLLAERELEGLPHDELVTYRDRVKAVTADMVLAAMKKHYHPERMTVLVVGDRAAIEKGDGLHEVSLSDFGEIEVVEPE